MVPKVIYIMYQVLEVMLSSPQILKSPSIRSLNDSKIYHIKDKPDNTWGITYNIITLEIT